MQTTLLRGTWSCSRKLHHPSPEQHTAAGQVTQQMKDREKSVMQDPASKKIKGSESNRTALPCVLTHVPLTLVTRSVLGQRPATLLTEEQQRKISIARRAVSVLQTKQKTGQMQQKVLDNSSTQLFLKLSFKTLNKLLDKTPLC